MRLCENCYRRLWVAKIDPKTGLQVVHKNGLRVFRCARCGWVQEEEKMFLPDHFEKPSANILYIDIEISKIAVGVYDLHPEYIHWSNILKDQFMISWAASYVGNNAVWSDCVTPSEAKRADDKRISQKLRTLMEAADLYAGHNFDNFDYKHITTRFDIHNLPQLPKKKTYDTLKISRRRMKHPSNSLDYLTQKHGIGAKDDITNEDWMKVLQGDKKTLDKIHKYNRGDVVNGKALLVRYLPLFERKKDYGAYQLPGGDEPKKKVAKWNK